MIDYDSIYKDFDPQEFFLKKTKNLVEHDSEIIQHLRPLYETAPNEIMKHRLGTIMNSIFTQESLVFMVSRNTVGELYANDVDSKYRTISNSDYSQLLRKMTHSSLFQTLREHTANKAGVYKLVQPELAATLYRIVGKKVLEEQEKEILNYYDNKDKVTPTMTREERKAKARAKLDRLHEETLRGKS